MRMEQNIFILVFTSYLFQKRCTSTLYLWIGYTEFYGNQAECYPSYLF